MLKMNVVDASVFIETNTGVGVYGIECNLNFVNDVSTLEV